eukprot:Amastigsp_a851638_29.p2 type:complete len:189 gc:universal Amastigsp_a851638_29:821-255(-)
MSCMSTRSVAKYRSVPSRFFILGTICRTRPCTNGSTRSASMSAWTVGYASSNSMRRTGYGVFSRYSSSSSRDDTAIRGTKAIVCSSVSTASRGLLSAAVIMSASTSNVVARRTASNECVPGCVRRKSMIARNRPDFDSARARTDKSVGCPEIMALSIRFRSATMFLDTTGADRTTSSAISMAAAPLSA